MNGEIGRPRGYYVTMSEVYVFLIYRYKGKNLRRAKVGFPKEEKKNPKVDGRLKVIVSVDIYK